jgi:hypothetical protein
LDARLSFWRIWFGRRNKLWLSGFS